MGECSSSLHRPRERGPAWWSLMIVDPLLKVKVPGSRPWWQMPGVPALEKLTQEERCAVETNVDVSQNILYEKNKNKSLDSVATLPRLGSQSFLRPVSEIGKLRQRRHLGRLGSGCD